MRSEWESLHRGLVRSIGTREAERRFGELQGRVAAFARFEAAPDLVEYLAHPGGDLDDKDRLLAELAIAASAAPAASLAMSLLLLGLWPGLDAAFRRRVHCARDDGGELAAQMVARFTEHVRRLDLTRVHRIAATLVRNTERDVMRTMCREVRQRLRMSSVSIEVAETLVLEQPAPDAEPRPEWWNLPVAADSEREIPALRSWLAEMVGQDADLVVDALLLNRSRRELGAERGIDERAARKRLQRALGRIRRCLEGRIPASRGGQGMAFARP